MREWQDCRIKDAVSLVSVKSEDLSLPYIALDNIVSWDAQFIPSDSSSDGNSNECAPGDVLFGKLRPYLAKAYIPTEKSICSPEFLVMRPNEGTHNKFMLYYFLSKSFISHIRNQVAGTKMPRTKWSDLGSMSFSLPPVAEQEAIAAYLDKECEKIGREIELLERKADAYTRLRCAVINQAVNRGLNPNVPLKSSGNNWLGEIPEHWIIERNKNLLVECKETVGDDKSLQLLSLTLNGVIIRDIEAGGKFPAEFNTYIKIKPNNLIFCLFDVDETPRTIGLSNHSGMITGAYDVFDTLTDLVIPKWVYYFYFAVDQRKALKPFYTGLRKVVKTQNFANIHIPVPPINEQGEIVAYLDEKCCKIDAIIEKINAKVERLKELKRSLINEVVTGKRAINNI